MSKTHDEAAASNKDDEDTGGGRDHTISFTVDTNPLTATAKKMTAAAILQLAGLDPETHYLVLVKGRKQDRLANDEIVNLHDDMTFVSGSTAPTPTS